MIELKMIFLKKLYRYTASFFYITSIYNKEV